MMSCLFSQLSVEHRDHALRPLDVTALAAIDIDHGAIDYFSSERGKKVGSSGLPTEIGFETVQGPCTDVDFEMGLGVSSRAQNVEAFLTPCQPALT